MSGRERLGLALFMLLVIAYIVVDTKKDNTGERLMHVLEQRVEQLESQQVR